MIVLAVVIAAMVVAAAAMFVMTFRRDEPALGLAGLAVALAAAAVAVVYGGIDSL